jgi:hypothetical protein
MLKCCPFLIGSLITTLHIYLTFYRGFGMRQQAVELALKVDPSLARELAQDSVELEERRRLWLMIAKSAASEGVHGGDVDVVSKVVSVLKDCGPDVLSIEDVRMRDIERYRENEHSLSLFYILYFSHIFTIVISVCFYRYFLSYRTLHKLTKLRTKFVKHLLLTLLRSKVF